MAFFLAFFAFALFGKTKFTSNLFAGKINKCYLIDKMDLGPPQLSGAKRSSSRRDFLKMAGFSAAGAVVAGAAIAATQPVAGPGVTLTVTETLTETVPPSVGDLVAFRSALERDGFVVGQGAAAMFPLIEAYEAGLIKACWGNDPTKPYLVCLVPPAPGEQVPSYKFKVGEFH